MILGLKFDIAEQASADSITEIQGHEGMRLYSPPHVHCVILSREQYAARANCSKGKKDDRSDDDNVVTADGSMKLAVSLAWIG